MATWNGTNHSGQISETHELRRAGVESAMSTTIHDEGIFWYAGGAKTSEQLLEFQDEWEVATGRPMRSTADPNTHTAQPSGSGT